MGVGKKKVFTDSTKHQRYYAKNKEKRLTQTHERRKKSPWENVFYGLEPACKVHNKTHYPEIENEFDKEEFKKYYEANSKGMEHPMIHRLNPKVGFNEKNCVIIERKWFPYLTGKSLSVEEKQKLIAEFKKGANKGVA